MNVKKVKNVFVCGGEQPRSEIVLAKKGKRKYRASRRDVGQVESAEKFLKNL